MSISKIMSVVLGVFKSAKERALGNKASTVTGGVLGVAFAALIGKLEEASGCKFATAFANVDWLQVAVFVYSQVYGALSTDANKTVGSVSSSPSS